MSKPEQLFFQLINTNTDYIEFVVSYFIGEDQWLVDGIGWLKKDKPSYYLRLIRLNGFPARGKSFKDALIVEKKSSLIFENKLLAEFTLTNIDQMMTPAKRQRKR